MPVVFILPKVFFLLLTLLQNIGFQSTLHGFRDLMRVGVNLLLHARTLLILYILQGEGKLQFCLQVLLEDRKTNRLQEAR